MSVVFIIYFVSLNTMFGTLRGSTHKARLFPENVSSLQVPLSVSNKPPKKMPLFSTRSPAEKFILRFPFRPLAPPSRTPSRGRVGAGTPLRVGPGRRPFGPLR